MILLGAALHNILFGLFRIAFAKFPHSTGCGANTHKESNGDEHDFDELDWRQVNGKRLNRGLVVWRTKACTCIASYLPSLQSHYEPSPCFSSIHLQVSVGIQHLMEIRIDARAQALTAL